MKIKSLNCEYLKDSDIVNLNRVNIHTAEQMVTYADLDALSRISNVPLNNLKKLRKYIIGSYAPLAQSASSLLSKYSNNLITLKLGCQEIDNLISGGLYSGEITEITGISGIGKTQMCFNLVANLFKLPMQKKPYNCLYIDSCQSFCVRRMLELTQNKDHLKSIQVINCQTAFQLMDILYKIEKTSPDNQSSQHSEQNEIKFPKLLVIDNLTSLFTIFKNGTTYNIDVSFHLNTIFSYLSYLAVNMNMIIVFTSNLNQDAQSMFNESWRKFVNLEILIRKLNSDEKLSRDFEMELHSAKCFEIVKGNRPNFNDSRKSLRFKFNETGLESDEV